MNLPPIEDLLLHRGTMLLLDRTLDFDRETVAVEYTPRAEAWYADTQGNMPSWMGIELMAQAVAVHVALTKRLEGMPVQLGVLLGTRRYTAHGSAFVAGAALRIEAKQLLRDDSGLGAYECRIIETNESVAEATLKVYEPEDPMQFLQMQEQTP